MCQECTELYKKDLNDLDNQNGVVSHSARSVKTGILEYEVKWALGSITMNTASGGDGIPADLFLTLKMMLLKYYIQYATKFQKPSKGHSTGKGQFSSQPQRKSMPRDTQTSAQLHSSHMLAK